MKNSKRVAGLTVSRASILRLLRGQSGPVTIDQIARLEGKHDNTVREQVTWLVDNGLANRVPLHDGGRGRPRWGYVDRGPRCEDESSHASAVTATFPWELVDAPNLSLAAAREVGRAWGADLVRERTISPADTPRDGRQALVEMLTDLGYAPVANDDADRVVLHRCPMLRTAARHSEVICQVHLGMVQTSLQATGQRIGDIKLVPFAEPGECLLTLGP